MEQMNPHKVARKYAISPRSDKNYFRFQIKRDQSERNSHLGLSLSNSKTGKVVVNSLDPNSFAANVMEKGDRLLVINDQKVTGKDQCKEMIVGSKGNFTGVLERYKKLRRVGSYVQTCFEVPEKSKLKTDGNSDIDSDAILNAKENRITFDPEVIVQVIPADYPDQETKRKMR